MSKPVNDTNKQINRNNDFKFNTNNNLKNKLNSFNKDNTKDLQVDIDQNENNSKRLLEEEQNDQPVELQEDQDYENEVYQNEVNESQMSKTSFPVPKIDENDIASGKASSAAIIAYLNDKIRFLEVENKALREEITKNHSFTEKEKIDYYLRLRKELIEENEKLISEKKMKEIDHKGVIDKLNLEVKDLKERLRTTTKILPITPLTPEEKVISFTSSTNQLNQNVIPTQQNQTVNQSHLSNDSFSNTKYFKTCEAQLKVEDDKTAIQKLIKEQKDKQVGPKNSIYNLNKKDHNNPFIPVIDDLEERVKLLEKTINQKEAEILELNEVINTNEQIASRAQSQLRLEINKWKEKYLLILATRKTISQEFSELNLKTTENIKRSMAKQTYDMESKILHLEKLNTKLNEDMKNITKADHDHDKQKLNQIINLKRDLKALLENYDDLYRNYEESLKILTKQIDSIKQLYLTREGEFLNLTNYYIETINDFSKPVTDLVANPNNVRSLEEALIIQNKQTEEMRKTAEKYIKENSMIKSENFESKAIMRQKINDAMKFYDDSIKNISDNHASIEVKLSTISKFMEEFDDRFFLFKTLIEDKKMLADKVNELEIKIRMITNDDQTKEILRLRETNFKLSKELESKVQLMKDMEEISEYLFAHQTDNHMKGKTMSYGKVSLGLTQNSLSGTVKTPSHFKEKPGESPRKMRPKDVSFDTVMKMKGEIAMLNSRLVSISKSKDEIEFYYQEEMKKLLTNLEEKNEIIDQLNSELTKNENEHFAKKETVFNLWMMEFKEFKENLITISDIRNTIEKFKIEGGELKIQRDKLVNEEIYLLRQEIKTKDKSIADLKANYKRENQSLNELFEQYKKGIENRISTLDNLLIQRESDITALKNEKRRILEIESRKKEVRYYNNIFSSLIMNL